MNNEESLKSLAQVVEEMHNCKAEWVSSEYVEESFNDQPIWEGTVEVFALTGHPKAKRAYAWAEEDRKNGQKVKFVAVLEIPPVVDATTAVQVSIVAEGKN